jgi:hypothetical protein
MLVVAGCPKRVANERSRIRIVLHNVFRYLVSVEDTCAHVIEHAAGGAFSASNAAGKS